jgi:hypothetical protein
VSARAKFFFFRAFLSSSSLGPRKAPRDLREKANRFRSLFSLSFSLVARDDAAVRV